MSAKKTKKIKVDPKQEQAIASYPLSFESPESSNVFGAEYNPETKSLTITFGGKSYFSKGGPHTTSPKVIYDITGTFLPVEWEAFYASGSKGKFYNINIAPFHKAVKRDSVPA